MCVHVTDLESLRAIAETFHAAKKLNDEDVLITDTKLDKYEICLFFRVADTVLLVLICREFEQKMLPCIL